MPLSRSLPVLWICICALLACSSSGGSPGVRLDTGNGGADPGAPADPGGVTADRGPQGGTDPGAGADPGPPPDVEPVVCPDDQLPPGEGAIWPFLPITTPGGTFSCTRCPTGLQNLKGDWRLFDGDDPTLPAATERFDIFHFDGNTWTEVLYGVDSTFSATPIKAVIRGYFFCPSKAELPSARRVFVIQSAAPDGAFGNHAGDTFACDLLFNADERSQDFLLLCDFDWDGKTDSQAPYCKDGGTFRNKTCVVPNPDDF